MSGIYLCLILPQSKLYRPMKKSNSTYAEASNRLEEIVRCIEQENPDVDKLTKLVTEAVELTKYCREVLTKADNQLEELMARLDEIPKT